MNKLSIRSFCEYLTLQINIVIQIKFTELFKQLKYYI